MGFIPNTFVFQDLFNPPTTLAKLVADGVFLGCLLLVTGVIYRFLKKKD